MITIRIATRTAITIITGIITIFIRIITILDKIIIVKNHNKNNSNRSPSSEPQEGTDVRTVGAGILPNKLRCLHRPRRILYTIATEQEVLADGFSLVENFSREVLHTEEVAGEQGQSDTQKSQDPLVASML